MDLKTRNISTLIESQLPDFIVSEYENFSKVMGKYYEHLETRGQTLDVINNITKYLDIDFYQENVLKEFTTLTSPLNTSSTTITVEDTSSFPKRDGYLKIGDEVCFYTETTATQFLGVSRGVSGNTRLGDLYESTEFVSSDSASHPLGAQVYNLSNLFLYAFVKNFESEYLGSFPEKYLKGEVDKRTLIKNISNFYRAKGTNRAIKFIFNTLISRVPGDSPEVLYPKDRTLKASESDWISDYTITAKILSGNAESLVGQTIVQTEPYYTEANIDSVKRVSEGVYQLSVNRSSVNREFSVSTKTFLVEPISALTTVGDVIHVYSTVGWSKEGKLLIGTETFSFDDKNVNQFVISGRSGLSSYPSRTEVYNYFTVKSSDVEFIVLGSIYSLNPSEKYPYSSAGDKVQISSPGFTTTDRIIYDTINSPVGELPDPENTRWFINESRTTPSIPTNIPLQQTLSEVNADVSAIFEDDQYYYICSSGYPSHEILNPSVTQSLSDLNLLRLVKKYPQATTEIYSTTDHGVGVLLDGSIAYGVRDDEKVKFGPIIEFNVNKKGSGYQAPPFVLVNNKPERATAILSGSVVESIVSTDGRSYSSDPVITITSGRNAEVEGIVTQGRITSLVIADPGEYYSSPPSILIFDRAGKGRFAEYKAIVADGKIVDFEVVDEGKFYTKENLEIQVIPTGSGAEVTSTIRNWTKNRYQKFVSFLDSSNGYVFENYAGDKTGYGVLGNPKRLRSRKGDNIDNNLIESTSNFTHSPILGFAFDGFPIYGPYAHEDSFDAASPIVKMQSGYQLNTNRTNGPNVSTYPLGSFIEDYTWKPSFNKFVLDSNNGRFCVTPEYPEGTYAYFVITDSSNNPVYPYIVGNNYYGLPVDSNYNSPISQLDIPKSVRRYNSSDQNGSGVKAVIDSVTSGSISGVYVDSSLPVHSVDNNLIFVKDDVNGVDVAGKVSSVKGVDVDSIQSKGSVGRIVLSQSAFLFEGNFVRQDTSGATGRVIRDVFLENVLVLEQISGSFDETGSLDTFLSDLTTSVNVVNVILDDNASFTSGATITLTDGRDLILGTGTILQTTSNQNSVKIDVTSGSFFPTNDYILRSSNLEDTPGTKIISLENLSNELLISSVDTNYALISTTENHNVAENEFVTIDVNPDPGVTETEIFVRKRLYQEIDLRDIIVETRISIAGLGEYTFLLLPQEFLNEITTFIDVPLNISSTLLQRASFESPTIRIFSDGTSEVLDYGDGIQKNDLLIPDVSDLPAVFSTLILPIIRVDHAGVGGTTFKVDSTIGLSVDDYLQVNREIVRITNVVDEFFIEVERGQFDTELQNHFRGNTVTLYNPEYDIPIGYRPLGNNPEDPFVVSYDPETKKLVVGYDYGVSLTQANQITRSNLFFDASVPEKRVRLRSVSSAEFRLEFSYDDVIFIDNPTVEIQNYYRYKFNTSHISMTDTYLNFSPSFTYNINAAEVIRSEVAPGFPGSFVTIQTGFGPRISTNDLTEKKPANFTNYFYFILADNVNTGGASLSLIEDPLSGPKKITYVSDTKLLYSVNKEPQYNGSGVMSYTTRSKFAVGEINTVSITNPGRNYTTIPVIEGVEIAEGNRPVFDLTTSQGSIRFVSVLSRGSNLSKPKISVVDPTGTGAVLNPVVTNGQITSVSVQSIGSGYTNPVIKVIETDLKLYAESSTIGVPDVIKLFNGGVDYHLDRTTLPKFSSNVFITFEGNPSDIKNSQIVYQNIGGIYSASGRIVNYKDRTNILKLTDVSGEFRENLPLTDADGNFVANIISTFSSLFDPIIRSFIDNIGFYKSSKGKISDNSQKITDSFFYQDYSYVIESKSQIGEWRDLVNETVHPAGFKLFGEYNVETEAAAKQPEQKNITPIVVTITTELPKIISSSTRSQVTVSQLLVRDSTVSRGTGQLYVDPVNNDEITSGDLKLFEVVDGRFDPDSGQLIGRKQFTLYRKSTNSIYTSSNDNELVVSINGVIQEPGVAYTLSGSKITFAEPPFGVRVAEGQALDPSDIIIRSVKFKASQLNDRYLRKIRNIYQRNGRWLDAANQVKFNKKFIINEAIGYAQETFPNIAWNSLETKCRRDIGYIVDAIEFDLRFGGNLKTVTYAELYFDAGNNLKFIDDEKAETIAVFEFVLSLCAAAVRNWDITYVDSGTTLDVVIDSDSDIVRVPSTFGIVPGMNISSGSQFPEGTKVLSIIDDNWVRLTNASFADIGDDGFDPLNVGPTETITIINDDQTYTVINNEGTINIGAGGSITSVFTRAKILQITFFFSNINNGTYYDASNQIEDNLKYIVEETIGWANDNYVNFNDDYVNRNVYQYLNASIFHLRYGGNRKFIEFGRKFYLNRLSVLSQSRKDLLTGSLDKARELSVLAMRNQLPIGTYTTIAPVNDPDILPDPNFPACEEVESTINTYYNYADEFINIGENLVPLIPVNEQTQGNWTAIKPYSNNNIIQDDPIFNTECQDVISTLQTLSSAITDTINNGLDTIPKTNPDYFNGETSSFDLFYENGDIVKTEITEDLLISLSSIIQLSGAYQIERSQDPSVTDKIVFFDAPKWDQGIQSLTIGEASAVEEFFAYGYGNYARLGINKDAIPIVGKGPYQIIDKSTKSVTSIDAPQFAFVFVDGILQDTTSYTINGGLITFAEPLTYYQSELQFEYANVEILQFFGRKIDQEVTAFNFEPDQFKVERAIRFSGSDSFQTFKDFVRQPVDTFNTKTSTDDIYVVQLLSEVPFETKLLGTLRGYGQEDEFSWYIKFVSNVNHDLTVPEDEVLSILFTRDAASGDFLDLSEQLNLFVDVGEIYTVEEQEGYALITVAGELVVGGTDEIQSSFGGSGGQQATQISGRLERDAPLWMYHSLYLKQNAFINGYSNLAKILPGDKVRIDGEKDYRNVIQVPTRAFATNFNLDQYATNNYYGTFKVSNYDGFRPNTLIVNSVIDDGQVVDLNWNKPEENNKTTFKPNKYYQPPFIQFIPTNNQGGGAEAQCLVVNGDIVDIIITNPGSGYTEPPLVLVTRGFDIIKSPERLIEDYRHILIQSEIEYAFPRISRFSSLSGGNEIFVPPSLAFYTPDFDPSYNHIKSVNLSEDISDQLNVFFVEDGNVKTFNFFTDLDSVKDVDKEIINRINPTVNANSVTTTSSESIIRIERSLTRSGEISPIVIPLGQDILAQLALDLNLTDTIVYVVGVNALANFPNSGIIQIGLEIMTYTSRLGDRFLGVTRGAFGSTITTHLAGADVRYLPTLLNVAPAPTILDLEVIVIDLEPVTQLPTRVSKFYESIGDQTLVVSSNTLVTSELDYLNLIDQRNISVSGQYGNIVTNNVLTNTAISARFENIKREYEAIGSLNSVVDNSTVVVNRLDVFVESQDNLDVSLDQRELIIETQDQITGLEGELQEVSKIYQSVASSVPINVISESIESDIDVADVETTQPDASVIRLSDNPVVIQSITRTIPFTTTVNSPVSIDLQEIVKIFDSVDSSEPVDLVETTIEIFNESFTDTPDIAVNTQLESEVYTTQSNNNLLVRSFFDSSISEVVDTPGFIIQTDISLDVSTLNVESVITQEIDRDIITSLSIAETVIETELYTVNNGSTLTVDSVFTSELVDRDSDLITYVSLIDISDTSVVQSETVVTRPDIFIAPGSSIFTDQVTATLIPETDDTLDLVTSATELDQEVYLADVMISPADSSSELFAKINPSSDVLGQSLIADRQITSEVNRLTIIDLSVDKQIESIISAQDDETLSDPPQTQVVINVAMSAETVSQSTKQIRTGVVDYLVETALLDPGYASSTADYIIRTDNSKYANSYTLGTAGPSITNYEIGQFYSFGVDAVDEVFSNQALPGTFTSGQEGTTDAEQTLEVFSLYYPYLVLGDFSDRLLSNYTLSGTRWNAAYPTYQEFGTKLTAQLDAAETTTIDVIGTRNFPTSGRVYIGNELIEYTGKTSTTLTGLTRGVNGTPVQTWIIDEYVRTTQ